VISATTRVAAAIGSPVRHSLSPALHNAGFAATGVDWVYTAFEVEPGQAAAALDAMRVLGLGGLSVTMPHKEAVASLVDELDPVAAALRSVNTVVPIGDGRLKGYSTDGAGFVASMAAEGLDVEGKRICVIGAGAAARAIIDALARAGATRIAVVNRTADRAQQAADVAPGIATVAGPDAVGDCDIVVNATSIGMGTDEMPFDTKLLNQHQIVADIVYHPRCTALLAAARDRGSRTVEGLGMLVHQAVLQQQLWTGISPPATVMRAAAERELVSRGQ
jgi:shikimate dehydrogenase